MSRTQINSYLTFSGNCCEAMTFYKESPGGELSLQTIGESPLTDKMPPKMKECILHSTLTKDALLLMGTDMAGDNGLQKGNSVSLMLNCSSEEEIKNCFEKLSAGGRKDHPLENSFWGHFSVTLRISPAITDYCILIKIKPVKSTKTLMV